MVELIDIKREIAEKSMCRHPVTIRVREGNGRRKVRCGQKNTFSCPSCAKRYRADRKRLIGSGCNSYELDGVTDLVLQDYKFYYLTLTAPSFGRVHRAPKSAKSKPIRCACGRRHRAGDPLTGTPVAPESYKYKEQVLWNRNFGSLFHYTMKYLKDNLPEMSYNSAREWQKRGALHTHLIIRVPATLSDETVMKVLSGARSYRFGEYKWGSQWDLQRLHGDKSKTVGYLAKVVSYSAKSQDAPAWRAPDALKKHYEKLSDQAVSIACSLDAHCPGRKCPARVHKNFGFGGYLMSNSRDWSLVGLTMSGIRAQRVAWAQVNGSSFNKVEADAAFVQAIWDEESKDVFDELFARLDDDLWERFNAEPSYAPIEDVLADFPKIGYRD